MKALKLPTTLLKGKTLTVWLGLTEEQQSDYLITVDKLKSKQVPIGFSSLEAFHTWKLQPGDFPTRFEAKVSAYDA